MKVPFFLPYNGIYIEYVKIYEKYNIPVQQYHDGYEIFLMIDGERELFYNDINYTLRRGDIAIIKPFELHCAESADVEFYERYVLNFNPEKLLTILTETELKMLFDDFNSKLIHLNDIQFDIVYSSFKLIDCMLNMKNPLSDKAVCSAIMSLVMYIKTINTTSGSSVPFGLSSEVSFAIGYVNKNYKKNITLDMMSDMIHISKYHFCRIFKEATGMTFLEYVNKVRLSHAHRLLMQTDMTINDIALRTGFGTAAYLSRMFKKTHGVSPKNVRNAAH